MLPAINSSTREHRDVSHLNHGFQEITRLKDQLDFAEKDIVEEKRERARMKEQLRLQHDVIQRLYARLDVVESQQAEESRIVGRLLSDTSVQQQLLSETQRAARSDRDTASDLKSTKEKLANFSTMIREETQLLHQANNQLKVDVSNINEYMSQIFNHEQSNQQASSGRFGTLETNINAAMDCIRSLQKNSSTLDKQLTTLGKDTHTRESEIANSLEQMGECLKDAQTERRRLEEKMNNETVRMKSMVSEFRRELQQESLVKESERSSKESNLFQSIEEMSQAVTVIEQRVVEEVQLSSKDIENKTNARLGEVQGNLLVEQSARVTSEQTLRREVANVVNNLREHLTERLTHSISAYQKDREKIQKSIRQLNDSIGLIEKSSAQAKVGLEHIIQAEIKSRQGQQRTMSELLATTQSALGAVDDRRVQEYNKLKEEMSHSMEGAAAGLHDQLTGLEASVGEIKEQYSSLREEVELTSDGISEVRAELEGVIRDSEERVLGQITEQLDKLWEQVKDLTESTVTENSELYSKIRELEQTVLAEHEERTSNLAEVARSLETKVDRVSYTSDTSLLTQTCNELSDHYTKVDERLDVVEKSVAAGEIKLKDAISKISELASTVEEDSVSIGQLRQDVTALKDRDTPEHEPSVRAVTPTLSLDRSRPDFPQPLFTASPQPATLHNTPLSEISESKPPTPSIQSKPPTPVVQSEPATPAVKPFKIAIPSVPQTPASPAIKPVSPSWSSPALPKEPVSKPATPATPVTKPASKTVTPAAKPDSKPATPATPVQKPSQIDLPQSPPRTSPPKKAASKPTSRHSLKSMKRDAEEDDL